MIRAWYTVDKRRHSFRFGMSGHAGDENTAVCNAATTLAYTLAQNVRRMQEHGMMSDKPGDEPSVRMESGDAEISAVFRKRTWETARTMLRTIMEGYAMLAYNYPEAFGVEHKEEIKTAETQE